MNIIATHLRVHGGGAEPPHIPSHLLSERLTSLGIMGAPRVPPLNFSETIVLHTCGSTAMALNRPPNRPAVLVRTGFPKKAGTASSIMECAFTKLSVRSGRPELSDTHCPGRCSGTCKSKCHIYMALLLIYTNKCKHHLS